MTTAFICATSTQNTVYVSRRTFTQCALLMSKLYFDARCAFGSQTFVNEARIESDRAVPLAPSDTIRLGYDPAVFRVERVDASTALLDSLDVALPNDPSDRAQQPPHQQDAVCCLICLVNFKCTRIFRHCFQIASFCSISIVRRSTFAC